MIIISRREGALCENIVSGYFLRSHIMCATDFIDGIRFYDIRAPARRIRQVLRDLSYPSY